MDTPNQALLRAIGAEVTSFTRCRPSFSLNAMAFRLL